MDEALTAGLPEKKICQVKKDCIQKPIHESIEKTGFHPECDSPGGDPCTARSDPDDSKESTQGTCLQCGGLP